MGPQPCGWPERPALVQMTHGSASHSARMTYCVAVSSVVTSASAISVRVSRARAREAYPLLLKAPSLLVLLLDEPVLSELSASPSRFSVAFVRQMREMAGVWAPFFRLLVGACTEEG